MEIWSALMSRLAKRRSSVQLAADETQLYYFIFLKSFLLLRLDAEKSRAP